MHLAVINTKTHHVAVFAGRSKISEATFNTSLMPGEVEAMRRDPQRFLADLDDAPDQLPATA